MPAAYPDRLAREGAVLAASGLLASAALLLHRDQARRWPHQSIVQLVGVAALIGGPATTAVRRRLDAAPIVPEAEAGDGEPTPLWHVPLPMLAFGALVGPVGTRLAPRLGVPSYFRRRAGWDATLRVTGGSALVGLWQALVLRRAARAAEVRRGGATAVRAPGSRLGATRIAFTRSA